MDCTCQQCGKAFSAATASKQKYCSRACYEAVRGLKPRCCIACGCQFISPSSEQVYCSRECYAKARWGNRIPETRSCPACGGAFIPDRPTSIYCSRACYTKGRIGKERPTAQRRLTLVCETCGKEFKAGGATGKTKGSRFCSVGCAAQARIAWRTCQRCGRRFQNKQPTKYCSTECYHQSMRGGGEGPVELTCAGCGASFTRYLGRARAKTQKRFYCSPACYTGRREYARGADNPLWRGGTVMRSGYLYEVDHTRPPKPSGGFYYLPQHVRVAQEALGRPIKKGEHVHHLNGDKLDNRPENLVVVSSSTHRALHGFYSQQFQKEHAEKGDLTDLTLDFIASHTANQ